MADDTNVALKVEDLSRAEDISEEIIESNKKRLSMMIMIGGIIFIVLIIVVLILILLPENSPGPTPNQKENPYSVAQFIYISDQFYSYILINNRNFSSIQSLSLNNKIQDIYNSTTNYEPRYLRVDVQAIDDHLLNIRIYDANESRYDPPILGHSFDNEDEIRYFQHYKIPELGFSVNNSPFEFSLMPKANDPKYGPIISNINKKLWFFDKYLELELQLQTPRVYGLTDHGRSLSLEKKINYTLWNTNQYNYNNYTGNRHSSHPFILNQLRNGKFIGIFMHNTNALQFQLTYSLDKISAHWRMTGGIIDMYIIFEAEAQYIIKKYHHLIGNPHPIPFWAMGFHYSSSAWNKTSEMQSLVDGFVSQDIPLDSIGGELELTRDRKVFTINDKFSDLNSFVTNLHDPSKNYNINFIATIYPAIKKDDSYNYSKNIVSSQSGVMDCDVNKGILTVLNLNGEECFIPDFFNKNIEELWKNGLSDLYNMSSFDGIYFYGNEPTLMKKPNSNSSDPLCHLYDSLQFEPVEFEKLSMPIHSKYTVSYLNIPHNFSTDFNLHNLYSVLSLNLTRHMFFNVSQKQPFIISHSSSPSAGQYGSLITGESPSSYEIMGESIMSMINFNIFGIPHVGSNIGGFNGTLDDQLFIRWLELSICYPLARIEDNGDALNPRNLLKRSNQVIEAAKNLLEFRYSILRFYFSKLFEAYLWGGSVIHPLFFNFPNDDYVFTSDIADKTFVIGRTLYFVPALEANQENVNVYFPNWRFYSFKGLNLIIEYDPSLNDTGRTFSFPSPLGMINTFIIGGSIIMIQNGNYTTRFSNTHDLLNTSNIIVVAPDHMGRASGSLVYEHSHHRNPFPHPNNYRHYSISYFDKRIRFNKLSGFEFSATSISENFTTIFVLKSFDYQEAKFACLIDRDLNVYQLNVHVNPMFDILLITKREEDENIEMNFNTIESIVFGGINDHNFCKPALQVTSIDIFNNERELLAELETYHTEELQLTYQVIGKLLQNDLMSIQISLDQEKDPWIVPDAVDTHQRNDINASNSFNEFGFRMAAINESFYFEFAEPNDTQNFIWSTKNLRFSYVDDFIHCKSVIKSSHIFGLGERMKEFDLPDGIYSMFTRDSPLNYDYGILPGGNLNGMHPFYMFQLSDPHYFAAVLMLTSNPMDVRIRHLGSLIELDHIITGGILDMFFISKGSAEQVLRTYHTLIGKPYIIPYWAFGYHQSRWGYHDIDTLRKVVQNFSTNNLPLDNLWSDIDYMDKYRNFYFDPTRFFNMSGFVQELNNKGIQWIPIVDAAIARSTDYPPYNEIMKLGCSILSGTTNNSLIGIDFPGYAVFIDFKNPKSQNFWESNLEQFRTRAHFSGIWLDMNEISNVCDGECFDETHYKIYEFPTNVYDSLYYLPSHRPLEIRSLSMNAFHYPDDVGKKIEEFNLHSMFGFYSAKATYGFFVNRRERAFILSKSTFIGSGRYSSHWLGDDYSSFEYMKFSISGIMNFNLFGIPHTGSDVCGFIGPFDLDICGRFYQLGGFYPFLRSHNEISQDSKEPYVDPNLIQIFRQAMNIRYGLIRYMYSRYMHIARFGGSLFRPFLFEFPDDKMAYQYIDIEFMIGKSILVSPVLQPSKNYQEVYFPNSNWYYINGTRIFKKTFNNSGGLVNVSADLVKDPIPWFIRDGSIISWQDASNAKTIYDMKRRKINLMIFPFSNNSAYGELFYDHDDPDTLYRNLFHHFEISYSYKVITFDLILNSQFQYSLQYNYDESIDKIIIADSPTLNKVQCAFTYDGRIKSFVQLRTSFSNNILTIISNNGINEYDFNLKDNLNVTLNETGCNTELLSLTTMESK